MGVNLWEALGAWELIGCTGVAAVLTAISFLVLPLYMMYASSKADVRAVDGDADQPEVVRLPTEAFNKNSNFFGCGHCEQVFTERRALEVHTKFWHQGLKVKEVLTPMPRRF